jgi:H+/Cl- antiporter ClcA
MSKKAQTNYSLQVLRMFLLMAATTTIVVIFIEIYCESFSGFGMMSKQRLLNHPAIAFLVTPALFWVAAFLCRKYSPASSGNGMDYIKAAMLEVQKRK